MALGSAAELRTQLYIATKIRLLPDDLLSDSIAELKSISKMLNCLSRSSRAANHPRTNKPRTKTENSNPKADNRNLETEIRTPKSEHGN
jgi:hypothetical protein